MSSYVIGIDLNSKKADTITRDYVAKKFRDAGHDVETLPVGPSQIQNYGTKNKSTGKTALFLVNGADLQTYKDLYDGISRGYYKYKYCWFGLEGWISPSTCSCNGAKTAKLKKAHDDASSTSYTADIVGLTTAQVMDKYKSCIGYACGSSKEELANNLLRKSNPNYADNSGETTVTTIKDALKEVLSFWDGSVECILKEDKVYVQKIGLPKDTCKLSISEGVNIIQNSVTIHDYHPNTVNVLHVQWDGGKDIVLRDDDLIRRFGEVINYVTAVKYTPIYNTEDDDGESFDYEEENIKNYNEAYNFGLSEFNKIKRSNGHSLECQVIGSNEWHNGEWAKVNIPSLNINNQYMYITKVNHSVSENNEWSTSLTLTDYPPSLGAFEIKEDEDTEINEDEEGTEE